MHGLDALQHLLGEALEMHVRQRLLALDDLVQVAVHQLAQQRGMNFGENVT
jgi:hypothetical protein